MSSMNMQSLGRVAAGLALAIAGTAHGAAVVFDFEAESVGNKGASYTLSSSGVSLTITRIGGSPVEVAQRNSLPSSWGRNALSPFLDNGGGAFLLTFSSAFSSISVDVGDFQPSDADSFSMTVGAFVDSDSQSSNTGFPDFSTLSLTGLNATQAILSGGSQSFPQSVFWDNIRVETGSAVPEPGTTLLVGAAMVALFAAGRRRKLQQ